MSKRRNPSRARLPLARRRHRHAYPLVNTSREYICVRWMWYSDADEGRGDLQAVLTYASLEWQHNGTHFTTWTGAAWFATWGETADFALGQHWARPCVWAYDWGSGHDSPIMIGGTRDVSPHIRRRYQV